MYRDDKGVFHVTDDQRRAANAAYKIADAQLEEQKRHNELLKGNAKASRAQAEAQHAQTQAQTRAAERQTQELARQADIQAEQLKETRRENARKAEHEAKMVKIAEAEAVKAESHRKFTNDVLWLERSDGAGKAAFFLNTFNGEIVRVLSEIVRENAKFDVNDEAIAKYKLAQKAVEDCYTKFGYNRFPLVEAEGVAKAKCDSIDKSIKKGAKSIVIHSRQAVVAPAAAIILSLGVWGGASEGDISPTVAVSLTVLILGFGFVFGTLGFLKRRNSNKNMKILHQERLQADAELKSRQREYSNFNRAHERNRVQIDAQLEEANQRLVRICNEAALVEWDKHIANRSIQEAIIVTIQRNQSVYPPNCWVQREEITASVLEAGCGMIRSNTVSNVAKKLRDSIVSPVVSQVG